MTDIGEPWALTATEALRRIEAGSLSAVQWVASCRERIREREPAIRAWASLDEHVVEAAMTRERRGLGPSIPVGVKDIIDVCGMPTMMGTDFHDPAPATREGGSVALMREAGCMIMGKTVTTELGHLHPGPTRNPRNPRHTPGGSSSGSAAAVADRMVPLCLGTQTSGSVIRPAAYCGVIGYKPTYNDFDKSGILANAPSMDTLGILARSVDDVGLLRRILLEAPTEEIREADLAGLRFGLLTAPPWESADAETRGCLEDFMGQLAARGARRVEVRLDREIPRLLELRRVISGYEFRRSIAFERIHHLDRLSPILREGRLADGLRIGNSEYQSAIREVAALRVRLARTFTEVDILVSPSAPGPAPAMLDTTGEATFNSAWTLAGNPAITLPLFRASDGLPIGGQLVAGLADDDRLLSVSKGIMHAFGPGDPSSETISSAP
ncbi:MAG: amidase [Thiotrichales bacterium]|nr:amidase [Thiotrichales bacterium]